MDNKSRQRFDLLITALVPLVWGSTYLVTTQFLPPGIPLTAAVLRALPAGLILVLLQRKMLQGHWWWRAALLGVLNIGAFFYFLFLAAYHLPGGIAALLMSIQPVIVLIYSAILFRNPVRATQILACLCAALGVALVALRSDVMLNTQGVTAGLAGAFSMATGMVLAKKFGRPDNMSLLALTGWQLTFGGLALVPFALMTESFPETLTLRNIGGLSYLSLLGALVTYALWFRDRASACLDRVVSFASQPADSGHFGGGLSGTDTDLDSVWRRRAGPGFGLSVAATGEFLRLGLGISEAIIKQTGPRRIMQINTSMWRTSFASKSPTKKSNFDIKKINFDHEV
ncbi:EamA family transporter [Agrobacterium vitis]|uniref:EamA family transporter n=1 Tax=Agrobacterium vitis TaxID=373 RepID=UPI0032DA94CB